MLPFAGAVLAGGASRRMGVDKALIRLEGRALVARVADVIRLAGATEVTVIGGDEAAITGLGLAHTSDRWPGAGPLGGLVTAIGHAGTDPVVVLACDLVAPDPAAVRRVVAALEAATDADAAVPDADGLVQWLHGAWRWRAGARFETAFASGERAIHRAVIAAGLVLVTVDGIPREALADADTVDALPPEVEPG